MWPNPLCCVSIYFSRSDRSLRTVWASIFFVKTLSIGLYLLWITMLYSRILSIRDMVGVPCIKFHQVLKFVNCKLFLLSIPASNQISKVLTKCLQPKAITRESVSSFCITTVLPGSFPWRISSVIKSAVSCGFSHIYWRNP